MATVFTRIAVTNRYLGGALITWEVSAVFARAAPGPLTFKVYASRSGVGDWQLAGQVDDGYFVIDTERRIFGVSPRLTYRVEVQDADGRTYVSEPHNVSGSLSPHDANLARLIVAKEDAMMRRSSGQCGWLYKRRHWGVPCTQCVSQDTGEVMNASTCLLCFGTGILGGYHTPVEAWAASSARGSGSRRKIEHDETVNLTDNQGRKARMLACPWLDTDDVWVIRDSDQRYFVRGASAVEYRGLPILYDPVELMLADSGSPVYHLPRPDDM